MASAWSMLAGPARSEELRHATARRVQSGVPLDLAERIGLAEVLGGSFDIALIAERAALGAREAARGYFAITDTLGVDPLVARGRAIAASDRYERMAIGRALEAIGRAQRELTVEALAAGGGDVGSWLAGHREPLTDVAQMVGEILASGEMSAARLTVAAAEIGRLAGGR